MSAITKEDNQNFICAGPPGPAHFFGRKGILAMKELIISGTYSLRESCHAETLTIAEGTILDTGKKLATLTENGIEKPILPGTYHNAVITLTEPFNNPLREGLGMPGSTPAMKAAVYVNKNGIVEDRSVLAALQGGTLTSSALTNVEFNSQGEGFGLVAVDDCEFTIKDVTVTMSGTGGDDFNGKGCAIVAGKNSNVTIDGLHLESHGLTRNALLAAGNAKVTVKNSNITCYGVDDETQKELGKKIHGMISVPWVLGLTGNNRATNVLDSADVTYIDSTIRAERWGALSTDGPTSPKGYWQHELHLTAKNCNVEVFGESGYGTYCIGSGYNRFYDCQFHVPDYAEVIANEIASTDFVDTEVYSKRFGIMWHQNQGGLLHLRGSTFHTGQTTFLVKGCYPEILVEQSELNPKNGVILQLMESDDPGLGPKEVVVDTSVAEKILDHDTTKVNYHDGFMYNQPAPNLCTDLRVTFRDMALTGDLYNSTVNAVAVGSYNPNPMPPMDMPPADGEVPPMAPPGDDEDFVPPAFVSEPATKYPINLAVTLENVNYAGVISASVCKHHVKKISKENLIELGQVTNTASPVVNNGVIVNMDADTTWTVTGNCFLSALSLADGATLCAPDGKALSMTVNGTKLPIRSGKYYGDIQLTVE